MHKILIICALIGTVLALPPIPSLKAQVGGEGKQPDFVCKDKVRVLNTHVVDGLTKCSQEYGPTGGKTPNCKYFCNAKVFSLLNEKTGLPSQATYDAWVDREFEDKDKATAKAHFAECFTKSGKLVLEVEETTCREIKEFNDCTWTLKPQTC